MGLEDYKEIVATCAMITTMGQMLAGTLTCKDIYRKGSSRGVDPVPFLGGVGMCFLVLQYALILGDPTMINVNLFGIMTNVAYMAVYYYYSPSKKDTRTLIFKTAGFVSIFLVYAQLESPEKIEFRFGLITTALSLLLIASPFMHLGEIIKTKNTDILPFPLIFMSTLLFSQWFLYGLIINNSFLINAVGLILSAAQLSLFAIFPKSARAVEKVGRKTSHHDKDS